MSRASFFSMGFSSKRLGIAGRWANVHLPRFTSSSSGMPISSRWPTADEMTWRSLSKYSPWRVKPPSARAMSAATEGFSAMIRLLDIPGIRPRAGRSERAMVPERSKPRQENLWLEDVVTS